MTSVLEPAALTVRRPGWDGLDGTDPKWNPHHVELVAGMNAVSLLMPVVEPLIAGAVRSRSVELPEPLRTTAELFAQQELAHQTHHRAMNAVIRDRYRGVSLLERAVRRCYRWIGRRSSTSTLAFAASSETLAHALARWTADHPAVLSGAADPVWADLYLWHLAEEVEHKSVAFDVWQTLDGRRGRFLRWGFTSAVLVAVFATWGALVQLWGERRLRNPLTWVRLIALAVSVAFELLPALVVAVTKGHHPSQLADPDWFAAVLRVRDGRVVEAAASGSDGASGLGGAGFGQRDVVHPGPDGQREPHGADGEAGDPAEGSPGGGAGQRRDGDEARDGDQAHGGGELGERTVEGGQPLERGAARRGEHRRPAHQAEHETHGQRRAG